MQHILTCPNGKQIDFTKYILKQMKGEMSRQEVKDLILAYQTINMD